MAHASASDLLVLHTLRLKSFVDAGVIAAASRQPESTVETVLGDLAEQGLITRRNGRISGWSLTTAGRIEGERRLAAELDELGCREVFEGVYRRFIVLNQPFLIACTRWQLRDADGVQIDNDHRDPVYDESVVAELDRVDDAVQPLCRELATVLSRFAYYNGRFAVARVRVHAGEHEWFARPIVDSYHTVWFELHENLLATLNIERSSEARVAL
ncbi:MAG TPA: hypothetical protein VGQ20_02210 [Acidimicrobiales bacterium]|jgi:hypothetical protein|nr:hypothetical protein [Acidimicrobiales bacterium]